MQKEDFYIFVMNSIPELCRKYSYEQLFNIGREFPFDDRLKYDYKIKCHLRRKNYSDKFSSYDNEEIFLKALIWNNELDYIIDNSKDIFVRGRLHKNIIDYLKKNINNISEKDYKKIESAIAYSLYTKRTWFQTEKSEILKDLLVDITREENVSILDIEELAQRGYATVFKLGQKVIKVGNERICPIIPDNSRLLIPDFRGRIGSAFIEINDFVEGVGEASRKELCDTYKEIRLQTVKWIDPTSENAGIADKRIIASIKKKRATKNLAELGIARNEDAFSEGLKVGDLIVIDLDHLFWEDETDKIERAQWDTAYELVEMVDSFEIDFLKDQQKLTYKYRNKKQTP